ncbi:hypothetical protein [Phenylobacterium sp.]|uniref:hypothetical protein n=1 Tax=Phenylobacterium sp. TaxID=1871053 RepID=UPI002FCBC8E1
MVGAPNPGQSSVVEAIQKSVTAVTLVVGAVVSLNTFLTSCTAQKITDYGDFRKAVAAEETYWKGLYADYETTFAGDYKTDQARRDAKLFVISQLTEHVVPDFAEYKVPEPLKAQAQRQFDTYRVGLRQILKNPETSSPTVVAKLQAQAQAQADAAVPRPADGSVAPIAEQAAVAEVAPGQTATPSLDTVVLSQGRAQGWDIDVFWCQGPSGETSNYVTASTVANILASRAKAGEALDAAKAVTLGRVRLRPLSTTLNGRAGYNASGYQIRFERAAAGEPAAATAVLALVNSSQPAAFTPYTVGNKTPWYLSMFVCGPITPAPALTALQTVQPAPRPSAPAR